MVRQPSLANQLADLPRTCNGNVLHRFNQPVEVVLWLHFPVREYIEVYVGQQEGQPAIILIGNACQVGPKTRLAAKDGNSWS
jgi:hypothetical protein